MTGTTGTWTTRCVLVMVGLALCARSQAQGTIEFRCRIDGLEQIRDSMSPVFGFGFLVLQGDHLFYTIQVPSIANLPAEAHFHAEGTLLRQSLVNFVFTPDPIGNRGSILYSGDTTITEFLPELLRGDWYVQLHHPSYLNGVMRGYVTQVPEPTVAALLIVPLACLLMQRMWRR